MTLYHLSINIKNAIGICDSTWEKGPIALKIEK